MNTALAVVAQAWISLGLGLWFFRVMASPPTRWHSRFDDPGWDKVLFAYPFFAVALAPLLVFSFIRTMVRGHRG
jgi:hypothetical protein